MKLILRIAPTIYFIYLVFALPWGSASSYYAIEKLMMATVMWLLAFGLSVALGHLERIKRLSEHAVRQNQLLIKTANNKAQPQTQPYRPAVKAMVSPPPPPLPSLDLLTDDLSDDSDIAPAAPKGWRDFDPRPDPALVVDPGAGYEQRLARRIATRRASVKRP